MQFDQLKRRDFITLVGGAMARPLEARAQQPTLPVIGYLSTRSPQTDATTVAGFRHGLNQAGYFEGRNVWVEFRWASGQFDRLPSMAEELVRRGIAVLVTAGGTSSTLAAKAATSTIPIVFAIGDDPVQFGLVASLNRPGGNLTGTTTFAGALVAKQLGLLRELVPNAGLIAILANPNEPAGESQIRDAETAARATGQLLVALRASTEREIDAAFAALLQQRASALLLGANPFFFGRADQLIGLAARHMVPTMYWRRELVEAGGLLSYGAKTAESYEQLGIYTGRILRGAKPGDLPVMQPTRFELVINPKAAKAIGLKLPATLLASADEVIE
jgi:putative tryptophan/tyrosine transport system substrate-binding protein